MRHVTSTLLLFALLAPAGCPLGEQTALAPALPTETTSDSAGVRIVEQRLGPVDEVREITWLVDQTAELSIGGAVGDPVQELFRVTGAVRYDDGRLVVGLGSGPELRVYGAKGQYVRTIGRRGGGPGEFRFLVGPWYADSGRFLVYDQRQRRLSLLDTTGALLGSAMFPSQMPHDGTTILTRVIDGGPGGTALVIGQRTSVIVSGLSRPPVTFGYLDTAGRIRSVVGPYPGQEIFLGPTQSGGGGTALLQPLFALTTLAATCGTSVAIADNARYDIHIVDSTGRVKTIIRSAMTGEVATRDDFRSFLEMHSPPRLRITDEMVKIAREMSPHERLPVLHRLSCDPDGNLWVQEFARPAAARRRLVSYSMDGHRRGVVLLPARDSLLFVRGDRIVVESKGENDVATIEVRRLRNARRQ